MFLSLNPTIPYYSPFPISFANIPIFPKSLNTVKWLLTHFKTHLTNSIIHFSHCSMFPTVPHLTLAHILAIGDKNNQVLISHFQQAKHTLGIHFQHHGGHWHILWTRQWFRHWTACTKRALKWRKREDRLQILAENSFNEHDTWWCTLSPNFSKFGENFVNCDFLCLNTDFSAQRVARRRARLWLGHLLEEKFIFLGFSW